MSFIDALSFWDRVADFSSPNIISHKFQGSRYSGADLEWGIRVVGRGVAKNLFNKFNSFVVVQLLVQMTGHFKWSFLYNSLLLRLLTVRLYNGACLQDKKGHNAGELSVLKDGLKYFKLAV